MSVAAGLHGRMTRLAVGRHLPHRTVRVRLTLLYGVLFLLSGAALMAIAYVLLVNAGFVFSLQNPPAPEPATPSQMPRAAAPLGSSTHPSAQTLDHWRSVARCMREHGVAAFPDPRASFPTSLAGLRMISDRDGAIIAVPTTLDMQSRAFTQANEACGFMVPDRSTLIAEDRRRAQVRQELLIQSGIALAAMSLLSLLLGWLMAGRVLQPLEDSYDAQRQFVANAAHELRAPLTRQRALIEVALANPEADLASLRAAHERVLASERDLEQLIDALLALARSQAGGERREQLNLAALASQAILAREPERAYPSIDVRQALAPAPAAGDPRLIERQFANVIDNALRHNTPGGHVEITTGTRYQRAFLTITNSGPHVPPEEVPRLLRPFQRLGAARIQHNSGYGLGLAIVKAIADAHNAELTVLARAEGGLTVDISFPPPLRADFKVTLDTARARLHSRQVTLRD